MKKSPLSKPKPTALDRARFRSLSLSAEGAVRAQENGEYRRVKKAYFAAHPLCQVYLAIHGVDAAAAEREFGAVYGTSRPAADIFVFRGYRVPLADTIHHRNKRNGRRLVDERWFLSASRFWHDMIEDHKAWAREHGLLLPINADVDGKTPGGYVGLPTPKFMHSRIHEQIPMP